MSTTDATTRMDRMYRHQRHIYDLSRKFYLLGRDRLISELELPRSARICEIGCGTGRNLLALAERFPDADIFGIDASEEMLKTARSRIARQWLDHRIRVRRGIAEELDPMITFGLAERFDAIVFSYTLSMISDWDRAIDQAIDALRPDGLLAVVDFSEQRDLPAWFRAGLRRWLALFDVNPHAELPIYLSAVAIRDQGELQVDRLYRDYACMLRYRKSEGVRQVA
jgi:S-adenosylmethionine-diacylgycerolhomoserine-N-methlytransferase